MGWLLWLIGVAIAVIVALHLFIPAYDVPYVADQVKNLGIEKVLLAAVGITALAKVLD
jgi:hypothetical protein